MAVARGSRLDRPVALRLDLRLRALRYRLRLDPAEIAALCGALRPGDTALDIGAHKGGYLYWLQARVGPAGRVIAFEPQPDLADYLGRAMTALGARHVTVEALALSDRAGTALLRARRDRTSCGATLEARDPTAGMGDAIGPHDHARRVSRAPRRSRARHQVRRRGPRAGRAPGRRPHALPGPAGPAPGMRGAAAGGRRRGARSSRCSPSSATTRGSSRGAGCGRSASSIPRSSPPRAPRDT